MKASKNMTVDAIKGSELVEIYGVQSVLYFATEYWRVPVISNMVMPVSESELVKYLLQFSNVMNAAVKKTTDLGETYISVNVTYKKDGRIVEEAICALGGGGFGWDFTDLGTLELSK